MRHLSSIVVLMTCAAIVLGTQRWLPIAHEVEDMVAYERIARAAPSFPDEPVRRAFAERFPLHWSAGMLSEGTGLSLDLVYRAFSLLILGALAAVVHVTFRRLGLDPLAHGIALGALVVSAYPLHFLLATPGFVADDLFLLGLAVSLLGFAHTRLALVVGGLAVAVVGRQTAVPLAIVAGGWMAFRPFSRSLRWRAAALTAVAPVAVYAALRAAVDTFAVSPDVAGGDTVIDYATSARALAEHVAKTGVGVILPTALVLGAWLRARERPPWFPIVLAATVVVQPLLAGPAVVHPGNEPRLAALATPALVVAAAFPLRHALLTLPETSIVGAAIVLASLHPRYAHAPWPSLTWAAVDVGGAVAVVATLGRRRRYAREM